MLENDQVTVASKEITRLEKFLILFVRHSNTRDRNDLMSLTNIGVSIFISRNAR